MRRTVSRYTLAAVALLLAPSGVAAQGLRQPPAPRLLVPVFSSTEKQLGWNAANAIRSRLEGDVSPRSLLIVPKVMIDSALKLFGYPIDEALSSTDNKQLAGILRADEYVEGRVSRTAAGYRVDARLVLARDNAVSQPLPLAEGIKLGDVAAAISRSVRDALRQIEDEKDCYFASRQSKYDDAIKKGRAGIAKYDRATMARICLLSAYQGKKAPPDSVLRIAEDILAIDSLSKPALTAASQLYLAKGDTTKYAGTLQHVIEADPTNANLVNRVVNDLGAIGRAKDAVKAIEKALEANPGDAGLTRTGWLVYLAVGELKKALAIGEELVKLDTTALDSAVVVRMAQAAVTDSNPSKAMEWLVRGTERLPNNAQLHLLRGQQERKAGQTQPAIASVRRALALDAAVENGNLVLAQTFMELQQHDSAVTYIRVAAVAPSANKSLLATSALIIGNQLYKKAAESKSRDDYKKAVPVLHLADSLGAGINAKFLLGVTSYQIGASATTDNATARSCDLAKEAQDNFAVVAVLIPQTGREQPETAGQIMNALTQYMPVVENQVKTFCKAR